MSENASSETFTPFRHRPHALLEQVRPHVAICYAAFMMLSRHARSSLRFIDQKVFALASYMCWLHYRESRVQFATLASCRAIARYVDSNRVSVYSALKRLEQVGLVRVACRKKGCDRRPLGETCRHRKAIVLTYKTLNLLAGAIALARGYKNAYAIAYNKANADDVSRET